MKLLYGVAYLIFMGSVCFAQSPGMPQPGGFQPVWPASGGQNTTMPDMNGQVKLGGTAADIMRETYRNVPNYGSGNDPAANQRINEAAIRERLGNDPAYNPNLRNAVSNNFPFTKHEELFKQLTGIIKDDNARVSTRGSFSEDFNSAEFKSKTQPYTSALHSLKAMLSGKQGLSLSQAYFTMENSWGEAYMTQQEFSQHIKQCADFIRQWMTENKLNANDNANINYAVQQFMGSRIKISNIKQENDRKASLRSIAHDPYSYDFVDNMGFKDHRNFFLTKCLATGTGQCNSMPAVYLSLVEAVGGEAYLALVPQHSLVKYPDIKKQIRNYEPTSHWDITNEWYQDNMFIGALAAKNKLYLQPYDKKQIVADIILQLALGYFRKYGGADGEFLNDCVNAAKPYFPNKNNLIIYFTYSNLYGYDLLQAMRKHNINRLSDIGTNAETQHLYERWQVNEQIISNLGYQDEPRDMYEEMLKYHEFKGRIQTGDGKTKRNLFTPIN